MRKSGNLIAHIPARGGSKRVPAKNLRYLAGKPMLAYAIECALQCELFTAVYVNTDSDRLAELAAAYAVNVYRRPPALGSDTATGDDFTADFLKNISTDVLVMISPTCPLVTVEDVRSAVETYLQSDCDTLISCETTQMQAFCSGTAVNIDSDAPLAPSQQNPAIQILNWAVTIWDADIFLKSYTQRQSGYLGTKRLLFPISSINGFKISLEADFRAAELLLQARKGLAAADSPPRYWKPSDGVAEFADMPPHKEVR